ncbi:hypothetical protein SNOG_10583 [Parastagonospora nodorum SN15]|uniref:Uncharacterized protein n=1 Tax=Phaeosphaeria nodorum (strain SN15 / ATCC MYA-4574 / FGSC 10173) TaxID=321614 RepID=Q0UCD1_PHANO|nr:hypothetical protein SNOG_10583 [Parastagonospora nodorum SN15]EAT81977.2 hypothetical protein SNOG_10583 [Parastagonospora nodorum SN15]
MADYEVAEYMTTSLAGQLHPALLATPGSGIAFDGVRKRWVPESDTVDRLEKLAVKDKDMSGSLGKLRRVFRGLCRNAGVGQTAATLIPNDSFGFTSVLCGSLKAVFLGLQVEADVAVTGVKIFADPMGFTEKLREYQAELKMASQSFETRLSKLARDDGQQTVQLQYWANVHSRKCPSKHR